MTKIYTSITKMTKIYTSITKMSAAYLKMELNGLKVMVCIWPDYYPL